MFGLLMCIRQYVHGGFTLRSLHCTIVVSVITDKHVDVTNFISWLSSVIYKPSSLPRKRHDYFLYCKDKW